jgi:predicted metal-binding protein
VLIFAITESPEPITVAILPSSSLQVSPSCRGRPYFTEAEQASQELSQHQTDQPFRDAHTWIKIAIVGRGAYMDSGYGCPVEWRCVKAAGLGEGNFKSPSQVFSLIRCECPGRTMVTKMGMTLKLSEIKPDRIYLSSCLVNAQPGCPYMKLEEFDRMLETKTGVEVMLGTHDDH